MPDLSNSSFIPKKTPSKNRKGSSKKQVYIFTLISYVILFATLLGAGGTFFYNKYIQNQLSDSVLEFGKAVQVFKEDDMLRVQDFDRKVDQANARVSNSISMVAVLEALEAATIETVQIESLSISREGDTSLLLSASVQTDSFDSTIFQREVFDEYSESIVDVTFAGINASNLSGTAEGELGVGEPVVSFQADISIPVEEVPKDPADNKNIIISDDISVPVIIPLETVDSDIIVDVESDDEDESNASTN